MYACKLQGSGSHPCGHEQHARRHTGEKVKKVAIGVLISLKREAENISSEELETEIRKALEVGLLRIPWLVLKNVMIVEE